MSTENTPFRVNPREKALILMIRKIGHGTIEMIGIKDGLPDVVATAVKQRIDFSDEESINKLISSLI